MKTVQPGKWFFYVAMTGLVLRLAVAFSCDPLLRTDALEYHQYAQSLVKDHAYKIIYDSRQPSLKGREFYSFRPPGYPFFIAIFYEIFGVRTTPVLAAQAVLDFLSGIFLYLIARKFMNKRFSLLAFAGMQALIIWVPMYMSELFFNFLFLASLWIILNRRQKSRLWMAGAGVLWGWMILTKPEKIIFAPFVMGYLVFADRYKKGIINALLLFCFMSAVVSPWLWRGQQVHGKFVWITSRGGRTFYEGSELPVDYSKVYASAARQGLDEIEMDQLFFKLAFDYLKKHPGHHFRAGLTRLRNLWDLRTFQVMQAFFLYPLLDKGGWFRNGIAFIGYLLFLASRLVICLGVLGALFSFKRFQELFLIYLAPVLLTVFHFFLFFGNARYLAPAYPGLCIFFALWIRWLLIKLGREKDEKNHLALGDPAPARPEPAGAPGLGPG